MNRDRVKICDIISEMLDHPNEHGIYPTSTAYTKFELYIEQERARAIGWALAESCVALDRGNDPRTMEVPEIYCRALVDLEKG